MRALARIAGCLAAAALVGCGGSGGGGRADGAAGTGGTTSADAGGADSGGGDGGTVPAGQLRIELTPAGLLLQPGATGTLRARVLDAAGAPVAMAVTWQASGDAVTLTPGSNNQVTVTATQTVSSAQIVARAAAVQSAPVTVAVARLANGARVIDDERITSDVQPVDGQPSGGAGSRIHAVLSGAAPAAGELLVAAGKPFAGRVVSTAPAAGGSDVVLELLPLDQIVSALAVVERYDVTRLPLFFPSGAPASSTPNSDGSITRAFNLPIPDEAPLAAAPDGEADGDDTLEIPPLASGGWKLGPFYCSAQATAKPTFSASQLVATVTPLLTTLDLDLQVGTAAAPGAVSMKVRADGKVQAQVTGPLRLNGELSGSAGCQAPLIQLFAPVPPVVALLTWPALVIGARFGASGKIEVNAMELVVDSKVTQPLTLGFQLAPDGSFTNLSQLDPSQIQTELHPDLRNTTPQSPARLNVELRGGLYAEAALTSIPYLAYQKIKDGYPFLSMLELESGLKLSVKVGTIADQVNDPAFTAGYQIDFLTVFGLGNDLKTAFGWLSNLLQLGPPAPELKYEKTLFSSPTGGALTYLARYKQGERVGFDVIFNADTLAPELLGHYNVAAAEVWRKDGSGGAKRLGGRVAQNGETDVGFDWTADATGANAPSDVFAFVQPVLGEGFWFKLGAVQGWTGVRQVGAGHDQIGRALVTDPKGRVIVVGYDLDTTLTSPNHGGADAAWLTFNPIGGVPYVTLAGGTGDDVPVDIARGADGAYYVAGRSLYGDFSGVGPAYPGFYAWLMKLDQQGQKLWVRQWVTAGRDQELAQSVAVGPGGAIYVGSVAAGTSLAGTAVSAVCSPGYELEAAPGDDCGDVAITAFDPGGNLLWHTVDARAGWQQRSLLTVDPSSGDVVVAAPTWGDIETNAVPGNHASQVGPASPDYNKYGVGLWVFDGGSGMLRTRKYVKIDDANIGATDITADGAGNVTVVGNVDGPFPGGIFGGASDGYAMQLSALGLQPGGAGASWVTTFATPGVDVAVGVRAAPNGELYVTGQTAGALFAGPAGGADAFVARLTAGGGLIWGAQLGSAGNDIGTDVAIDLYGNVFICGETDSKLSTEVTAGLGGRDRFVAKLSASGTLQ